MNKRKLIWGAFGLTVLIQLAIPARWIVEHERVLQKGTPYKFRIEPVDPGDPFRGNYLTLDYEAERMEVEDPGAWKEGGTVYVNFVQDSNGYVNLIDVSKERPLLGKLPFFRTSIRYIDHHTELKNGELVFDHPFDRFYLEKERAKWTENRLFRPNDSIQGPTFGRVRILNGKAVLEDVVIGGRSVRNIPVE